MVGEGKMPKINFLRPIIPVFVYKRPELAMSAVGIAAFVLLMAAIPFDYIEKFGFHLGLGVGVGFLAAGTKALRNKYRNLGVLLVYCALAMIAVAGLATPQSVLAASALDDFSSTLVGALVGVVASVEDDDGRP